MSSLSNTQLKYLSSLSRKKYRLKHLQCIIEGLRLCEEALSSDWRLHELYITKEFKEHQEAGRIFGLAGEKHLTPVQITNSEMNRVTDTVNNQGVALLVDIPESGKFEIDPEWHRQVLLLDGISDPANFGTLLRSADWFGVRDTISGPGTVEWTNPKVIRGSMGAVFHNRIHESGDLVELINTLKNSGYRIYVTDLNGTDLHHIGQKSAPEPWALILGNEAHGVSSDLTNLADITLRIPGSGRAESLNVAMAGTVLLYDLTRREYS